ncbi:MAG: ATP-binding protein [Candidatus Thorarchaeota archaeon]
MTSILDGLESTAQVETPSDPFQRIVGQEHAVSIVRSAVKQHRHVLLCGAPGIGKSMLAKAAYTLLEVPSEEIRLRYNPSQPDRPDVVVRRPSQTDDAKEESQVVSVHDTIYTTPERIPFDISIKMGFRCPACSSISTPEESSCAGCGAEKRFDWTQGESYHGLFRMLDVVREPALKTVTNLEEIGGRSYQVTYEQTNQGELKITRKGVGIQQEQIPNESSQERVLIPHSSSRFIRVSGASPVELLGDVKHDPYGSAESLGLAAHHRVVPGAMHEAHEGILYIDEIAALGSYQSHLLTAMQDRIYSISGHNPLSSGAAVRVDDVPCDFILFASCNVENLVNILTPLRSRIRGYGYEVMMDSWIEKSEETSNDVVRFVSQTVEEDGRIPHLTVEALEIVLSLAEEMAVRMDNVKDSFTLRLRELGGLVRIAGDLAVQDNCDLVMPDHVQRASVLSRGINDENQYYPGRKTESSFSRDYFF